MKISKKKFECALARTFINPQQFAKKAGLSYPVICRVLNGSDIKPLSVGKIAHALGVDPEEIADDE